MYRRSNSLYIAPQKSFYWPFKRWKDKLLSKLHILFVNKSKSRKLEIELCINSWTKRIEFGMEQIKYNEKEGLTEKLIPINSLLY